MEWKKTAIHLVYSLPTFFLDSLEQIGSIWGFLGYNLWIHLHTPGLWLHDKRVSTTVSQTKGQGIANQIEKWFPFFMFSVPLYCHQNHTKRPKDSSSWNLKNLEPVFFHVCAGILECVCVPYRIHELCIVLFCWTLECSWKDPKLMSSISVISKGPFPPFLGIQPFTKEKRVLKECIRWNGFGCVRGCVDGWMFSILWVSLRNIHLYPLKNPRSFLWSLRKSL